MDDKLKIFVEKIKAAKNVVIMGHKNPDGDALCSVLALAKMIDLNYGIRCTCVYDGNIPEYLGDVPLRPWIKYFEKVPTDSKFDIAILVDYGAAHQLGGPAKFLENSDFIIEIDHHKNDAPIGALCLNDDTAAATGMILYKIMRDLDWEYDCAVLDLLTISIITDTGNFKFVRNGKPFQVAGELVDCGVNFRGLIELMNNKPRKAVLTEAKATANAEFLYHNRLAVAIIDRRDYRNMDGRGEMVLNLLGQIKGVEYIVLLKQQAEDKIGISIRSRGRDIDHIAAAFGGGGHGRAAGAVVNDTLENVRARVIELFKGM